MKACRFGFKSVINLLLQHNARLDLLDDVSVSATLSIVTVRLWK